MHSFVDAIAQGLSLLESPELIAFIFVGVLWGLIAGALPGVSATLALGSVLGLTFSMNTEVAVAFLVAILVGSQFGNSIPAILVGVPGTPAAVLTAYEGLAAHKSGHTGEAMAASFFSSVIGQLLSVLFFIALVVPLSNAALHFLSPEIFAMTILGMTSIASLTGKNVLKGVIAAGFGVLISTIGPDPMTSVPRLTLGNTNMSAGLNIIAVIIGLLAISELIRSARQVYSWGEAATEFKTRFPGFRFLRGMTGSTLLGTGIGAIVGAIPGAASDIASYFSYQQIQMWSKDKSEFGHGSIRALAAIDAAQNASIGGQLIPTIGMGIPGGPTMVLVMAALTLHGLLPGPLLMKESAGVLYASIAGLLGGTVALAIVGWPMAKLWIKVATIDRPVVLVSALALCVVGVFGLTQRMFDVGVAVAFGLIGYFMWRYGYAPAAAALGVVLGRIMEQSFRQGLLLEGGFTGLVTRPLTGGILGLSLLILIYGTVSQYRARAQRRQPVADDAQQQ